jgi:hypothetical protein
MFHSVSSEDEVGRETGAMMRGLVCHVTKVAVLCLKAMGTIECSGTGVPV